MSLGLRGGSKLHDLFGLFAPYTDGKLREIVGHARTYARRHQVEGAFRSHQNRFGWHISFHPAAPEILVTYLGGNVILDARTLETGPGYHAFVVGFIDYLTREHQWVWNLRSAILHFADDTGYYQDRDFAALQAVMAGEFAAMCQGLVEMEARDNTPQTVWLPQAFNLAGDRFAATALGFRDRAFFDPPAPERFFPWWEEGVTVRTAKNMALSKMWLDTSWRLPVTEGERRDLEGCGALIARARALGAEFAPDEGAGDIATLLRGEPLDEPGDAPPIGYERQDTWYVEPGDWSIAVPGYFRQETGDDGQLCSLLSEDRGVYIRSYFYDEEQAEPAWPEAGTEGYSEYLRFESEHYRVIFESGEIEEEDGRWSVWQGTYNGRKGSARISVVSSDADDAAWAEKVLRSVRPDSDMIAPLSIPPR